MSAGGEPLFLDCRGLRVAACRLRRGRRRVLALHGWLDNAYSFVPLAPHLHDCEVVAVDLPGHGHSAHRSADAHYLYFDWTLDVAAMLDALGWPSATLLGHSMGAGIACLFAAAQPQRTAALWLLDGLGWHSREAAAVGDDLAAYHRRLSRLTRRRQTIYPDRLSLQNALCQVVPELPAAAAALLVERGSEPRAKGRIWRYDPRLRLPAPLSPSEAQVCQLLARIDCPSLLLRPRPGYPFDEAQLRRRQAQIPRLQRHELPGGHHVHMQIPTAVAALLNAAAAAG